MSRVTLESGWLLQVRPWRDTSLLIEGLSRDYGRVGLVARGVRGPRGRWRGLLQPFHPLLLSWSGRGELATLSGAEPAGPAYTLRGETLLAGYYANELLLRLLARNDPHPELFDAYTRVIAGLQPGGEQAALRIFEKRLLDALGYGLSLHHTADTGEPVDAGLRYRFDPVRGPLAGTGGNTDVGGSTLLALAGEAFDDPVQLREARGILRNALDAHLGSRPMRTREMLVTMRNYK